MIIKLIYFFYIPRNLYIINSIKTREERERERECVSVEAKKRALYNSHSDMTVAVGLCAKVKSIKKARYISIH